MAGEPTVGLKAVFDGTAAVRGIKNVTDSIKATEKAAKAQSSATGGILRLQRSVQSLISTYAAVAAGVAAAGVAVWQSVKAYSEAEAVQNKLERAITNAEGSYSRYDAQVQKVISSSSRLAAVDDEMVATALATLTQATGDVTEAQNLLGLALDLSRAKGKDLGQTAEVIGKAYNGNVGALKRYGVAVKDGATATQVLAAAQYKYAGYAEDYGESTAGAVDRLTTSWGNMQEAAGQFAVETVHLDRRMNEISGTFDKFNSDGFVAGMKEYGRVFVNNATFGKLFAQSVNKAEKAVEVDTRTTEDATLAKKRYAAAIRDAKSAANESVDAELSMLRAQERVKEATKAEAEAIKKYGKSSRDARIATLELKVAKREAAAAAADYKKKADEARAANQRVASQKAILAALKTLAQRWGQVAAAAQRAKNAAQAAGKSTAQAAADARSAGLDTAYGAKKNARGGVYPGNRPTLGLLGEASWGDVVVPMNRRDKGAYDLLSTAMKGLGVGGGVTINVTGSKSDAQHIAVATRSALVDILDK